jgi:hypothetical protein
MPSFKDTNGKEWTVRIDAPKIREVRSICSLDLAANDGSAFQKLADDVVLLVDTLWVLCREQANGVTDVQFGQALVGDPLEAATKALIDGLLDFFPQPKRSLLRSLYENQQSMMAEGSKMVEEKITDPKVRDLYLKWIGDKLEMNLETLLKIGSIGATSKPASSASGPTDSLPPNS